MTQHFNLEALESAVLASPVHERGVLPDLARGVIASPEQPHPHIALAAPQNDAPDGPDILDPAPALDLMSEDAFLEMWVQMHDMGGGLVSMRTGGPCPLGEQARNEGGQVAGKAAYALISGNPALARMMLSTQSTFWGQLAAIGMHGFACVQIVRASAMPAPEVEFKHHERAAA